MKKICFILLIVTCINFVDTYSSLAFEIDLGPNIDAVSSGPFLWEKPDEGYRFRVIVILSEVYLNIFIQKIRYGEENCCAKIIKTYAMDDEKLEGKYKLFNVSEIKWLGYDSFQFKGNTTIYAVKNLDSSYKVIRQ